MSDYKRGDWVTLAFCGYCRNWQVDGAADDDDLIEAAFTEHQRECRQQQVDMCTGLVT